MSNSIDYLKRLNKEALSEDEVTNYISLLSSEENRKDKKDSLEYLLCFYKLTPEQIQKISECEPVKYSIDLQYSLRNIVKSNIKEESGTIRPVFSVRVVIATFIVSIALLLLLEYSISNNVEVLFFLAVMWLICSLILLRYSSLKSWLKYIFAFTVIPLIAILVTLSIIFAGWWAPDLLEFVQQARASYGFNAKIGPFVVIFITAPIPIFVTWIWYKVLTSIDKKLTHMSLNLVNRQKSIIKKKI